MLDTHTDAMEIRSLVESTDNEWLPASVDDIDSLPRELHEAGLVAPQGPTFAVGGALSIYRSCVVTPSGWKRIRKLERGPVPGLRVVR